MTATSSTKKPATAAKTPIAPKSVPQAALAKGKDTIEFAYKFSPEMKAQLYEYLQTRPMDDVEEVITAMFETEDPDPFYKTEGIQMLSELLRKKCPRKDAKRFFELLQHEGNLLKFKVSYGDKGKEDGHTMSVAKAPGEKSPIEKGE